MELAPFLLAVVVIGAVLAFATVGIGTALVCWLFPRAPQLAVVITLSLIWPVFCWFELREIEADYASMALQHRSSLERDGDAIGVGISVALASALCASCLLFGSVAVLWQYRRHR